MKTPPPGKDVTDLIKYSQSFGAVIATYPTTGLKTLRIKSQKWYDVQLQKFKEGEEVTLLIHNRRAKRSEAQNRYWWVYMTLLAQETGHTPEEIHEWAKGKFLTERIATVFGSPTRVKGSTTRLNKPEFSELIMKVEEATKITAPPTEDSF